MNPWYKQIPPPPRIVSDTFRSSDISCNEVVQRMKYNYGGENHKIPITDINCLHASCRIRIGCHYGRRISGCMAHEKDMNRASQSPFSHVIVKPLLSMHIVNKTPCCQAYFSTRICTGLSKLEFTFLKIVWLIHFWLN